MSHDLTDLLDRTAVEPTAPPDVDGIRARGRQVRRRRRAIGTGAGIVVAALVWVGLGQLPADVGPRIEDGRDVVGPGPSEEAAPSDGATNPGPAFASGTGVILDRPVPGEVASGALPGGDDLTGCVASEGDTVGVVLRYEASETPCVVVRPGQSVELVNLALDPDDERERGPTVTTSLGGYTVRLRFGETTRIDDPVSTYLEPGVHTIESDFAPARTDVWVLDAPAQSAGEQAILDALVAFARRPSDDTFAELPLADRVSVGVGGTIWRTVEANTLRDPAAWEIREQTYGGTDGPFSALDLLQGAAPDELTSTAGPHPRCAGPPRAAPGDLEGLRRLSVQPAPDTYDGCDGWFAVDLFVDDEQRIVGVTLDLWEP